MKLIVFVLSAFVALPAFAEFQSAPYQKVLVYDPEDIVAQDRVSEFLRKIGQLGFKADILPDGSENGVRVLTILAGNAHQVDEHSEFPNTRVVEARVTPEFDAVVSILKPYIGVSDEYFCIGGSCQKYQYTVVQ